MQQTSSIGTPTTADSFYFMFFATSIFLKDSKELQMSPDPFPKLKFSIYKGKNQLILGPQIFNNTRDVIKPNLTSGWSKLEKVQMCFFLKNFQSDRKVQFMGLLYDVSSDQQQFLGDIVLSTHKYVEAYHEGAELVHEQGQFGPYVVNYVVLIEKDRHRLEKLFKKYKESKEYLERKEVTEINVGSLAEAANSQNIIESAKGIENNDFRLGVDQDESREGSPAGKSTSEWQETEILVQQPEIEKTDKIENKNRDNDNVNELQTKIERLQPNNEIEEQVTIQENQNKSEPTQIQKNNKSHHSYQPTNKQQQQQRPLPNLQSSTNHKIVKKEQQVTVSKSGNINKKQLKPAQTTKSESAPKLSPPNKEQLNSEKKIIQIEQNHSNETLSVSQHGESPQYKITLKVLIFVLLFGIFIYHFLNPIENNLKPNKSRRQNKSSQKAESTPTQSKKNQKTKPKSKSK